MQTQTAPTPSKNGSVQNGKDQQVFSVYKTLNYGIFKIMNDNRALNMMHVKRLVQSFNSNHLVCPITVNERFHVIDGQHRLAASIETKLPVYYIVIPGYGINEVQILNANQKNWTKIDFLEMFCEQGKPQYLEFKKFMADFPDFGIQSAERLVTLKSSGRNSGKIGGHKMQMRDFEEGNLVIPSIIKSYSFARKTMEFKPFYGEFHRGAFVSAIMPLFSSKVYNHKEMLHKLSHCPSNLRLVDCNTVAGYRAQLEEIYNWKRQKDNKVSFRYE